MISTAPRRVLIIDWLGRGGIAQTAYEWARALESVGFEVSVVTRSGREFPPGPSFVLTPNRVKVAGAIGWHATIVREALRSIRSWAPDVVVVQNSVIPVLEMPVLWAARRHGAETIFVAHNAAPHEWRSGHALGLDRLLRGADQVVTHSTFVRDQISSAASVRRLPLPIPTLVTDAVDPAARPDVATPPTLLQFGVLDRGYKGGSLLAEIASDPPRSWHFRLAGSGATAVAPETERLSVRNGYLESADLVAEVCASAAVALPYSRASQSAVVVLTQALGRIPIASAVGGIPEQIDHGVDGLLLPPKATVAEWRSVLNGLGSDRLRSMGMMAESNARRRHAEFERGVIDLCR